MKPLEYLFFAPAVLSGLIWLYMERQARRRGTPKEQARRYIRDLEHDCLVQMGSSGEDLLRRMLIEDLKQVQARRELAAYMREHFGLDIDESREIPPLFPWPTHWRRKRAK